jgi:uncharacterized membrane protein (Fun14 family)
MTLRDLGRRCWERCIELWTFNGKLEDYVLFTVAKAGAFILGFAIGWHCVGWDCF